MTDERRLGEMLKALQPGERQVLTRSIDPVPAGWPERGPFPLQSRFLDVNRYTAFGGLRWHDFGIGTLVPFPPLRINNPQHISVHDLPETPVFVADPDSCPYHSKKDGWLFTEHQQHGFAAVVSQRVLDCMLRLDPDGIEHREVGLLGEPLGQKFHIMMATRVIDAVDLQRTNAEIFCKEVEGDPGRFYRRALFPGGGAVMQGGYMLREDIPADVHIFIERCSMQTLWSRTLWDAVAEAGALGLYATGPERFMRTSQLVLTGPYDFPV